jgi:hypothetical protein
MTNNHPRIEREKNTIRVMIKIFCKRNHKSKSTLCKDCEKLLEYAFERLSNRIYQTDKPTCRNCVIH